MEINILPQEVINQIAAGEVVERPAHLVKELVENSIDAGATELEVEFDQGGRFVKVQDNGSGMSPDNLKLALSRHATSKISMAEDLWSLQSFGFRGEALASIASVSRVKLISKENDSADSSESAWMIQSEFGKVTEPEAVGGEAGTSIIVSDLFENTPARLKFLKSDGAESAQIKNVLKALGMSYPQVSFRVRHKGKLLFYWPSTESQLERVKNVLGQTDMYTTEFEYENAKARVVVCPPQMTTGNSKQIWGFVQNRWVQDRSLQAAVLDAFRNLLMHGEFPIAAFWLDVPSEEVDVNIHPTKSQVKFRDSKVAFRAVNRATRKVLEEAPWLGDLIPNINSVEESSLKSSPSFELSHVVETPKTAQFDHSEFHKVQYAKKVEPKALSSYTAGDFNVEEIKETVQHEVSLSSEAQWARLQVIGQADLTYIVTQSSEGLVFVDQHAAHERVMFERIMKAWKGSQIDVQNFLLPLTVNLDEEQVEAIMGHEPELEKLGLSVEAMGPQVIAINAAPQLVSERSIVKVLEKLGKELIEYGDSFAFEKSIGEIVSTMACHSAIRAGQALSHEQMNSLLEQMDEFPLSSFCPHGRPVFVEYPFAKLERNFGRIV